mgnify:CR=1 FL=1
MKKIIIAMIAIATIVSVAIYAQTNEKVIVEDERLIKLESLAEQGDTAAIHRLIEFYDENSPVYVEVEEVIEPDGTEWSAAEVESLNLANKNNAEMTKLYSDRLDYWLEKGIAMNDPVALATMGMRMYYKDEANAIVYLSKAADGENAQAALFCGSACLNQGKGEDAFKYLSIAYKLGAPSAGWHLAMCYSSGIGTEPNREKAVEVMRHAALLNYPEAVSEMRRIEPSNKIWQHKADSLEIDFPDFPIIPD